jgi:plasmid maintenance system antidote protein VapI
MATQTIQVLNRLAEKLGGASDYRLAKELRVTRQAVSKWRLGENFMTDGPAVHAAMILGEKPEVILALLGAERTQDAEARKVWTNLARRLQRGAAAGIVTALGIAAFFGNQAVNAATSTSRGMYIMLNYRSTKEPAYAAASQCSHPPSRN